MKKEIITTKKQRKGRAPNSIKGKSIINDLRALTSSMYTMNCNNTLEKHTSHFKNNLQKIEDSLSENTLPSPEKFYHNVGPKAKYFITKGLDLLLEFIKKQNEDYPVLKKFITNIIKNNPKPKKINLGTFMLKESFFTKISAISENISTGSV